MKKQIERKKTDDERAKGRILMLLTRHVGSGRALDMGQLYREVYNRDWKNKHHDTRRIRELIRELRDEGTPICSSRDHTGGGYYLAANEAELNNFCRGLRSEALKRLLLESRLRKITLPELIGQMRLNLTGSAIATGKEEGDYAAV